MRPHPFLLLIGLFSAACGGQQSCEAMDPGLDKDRCLAGEIKALTGQQGDLVLQKAQQIGDPMVKGAAVSSWIADHAAEVPRQTGEALCNVLDGRDRGYCQRRLTSPHLQR